LPKRLLATAAALALTAGLTVSLAAPAAQAGPAGPYLAARQASFETDFRAAARYFERAHAYDRGNPGLMEAIVAAQMSLGDFERAATFAEDLLVTGRTSQVAQMARLVDTAAGEDYDLVLAQLEGGGSVGPLVDGLVRGWAQLGAGDMTAALDAFDELGAEPGLQGFAGYHKALALSSVGDFESAAALLEGTSGSGQLTRRGIMAHAQILSQLDRNADGLRLIDQMFSTRLDPGLDVMRAALEAGETVPFDTIGGPRDGMAEVFHTIARILRDEAAPDYTLLYARAAEYLRPDHVDAILASARMLEQLDQHSLAAEAYARVPEDHPTYHAAAMGRAETLRAAGDLEGALFALRLLTETHGELPIVHTTLADMLRQEKRFEEALENYDRAIEIYGDPAPGQWFVYFARGISHERLGDWPAAEADFRQALELNPGQPQVLNYLGYSLVEKKMKLDEALEMIEEAVAARPDSGYIVDSLGWVLFRLGRYEEAVPHMERAAELMPIDPVVNDHLGDVYWAVGRKLEAQFQWNRALSFIDHDEQGEADPDRIRRKLEVGLDQVLAEEGLPPLAMAANDDE
jgi:Flp pilus assembly protein TadD